MMMMNDGNIRKKLRDSKVNSKNDILSVLETCLKEMYGLLQREKRLHEAKSDEEIVEVTFSDFFFVVSLDRYTTIISQMMVRFECVKNETFESRRTEKLRRRLNTFYLQRYGRGKALNEKMKKWKDVSLEDLETRRDELLHDIYLELARNIVNTNKTRAFTSSGDETHIVVTSNGLSHDLVHEFVHVLSGHKGGQCTLRELSHLLDEGVTEYFAQLLCDRMNIPYDTNDSYSNATTFARYLGNIDMKTLFEIKFETETWRSRASSSTLSPKKRVREEILNVFISQIKSRLKCWIKDEKETYLIDVSKFPLSWQNDPKIMDIVKRVTPKQIRDTSSRESVDDKEVYRVAKVFFRGISIYSGMWDLPGPRFDDDDDDGDR